MKNAINATSTDLAVNAKYKVYILNYFSHIVWDSRGCDWMVARITSTYALSAYHHNSCEFDSHLWWDVSDTTFCDVT